MTSCHTLGRRRSTPASWNTAIGETRAARLEARQVPSSATATPLGAATAHASHGAGLARSTREDAAPLEHAPGRPAPPPCQQATGHGREDRDDRGLAEHHAPHLPRRRADQPEQAELAAPGGDHEAEGAADDEDRHEQRDARHDPEQAGQVGELRPVLGGQPGRGGRCARPPRRRDRDRRAARRRRRAPPARRRTAATSAGPSAGSAAVIIARARSSWRRSWRRRHGRAGRRPARPRGTACCGRTTRRAGRGSPSRRSGPGCRRPRAAARGPDGPSARSRAPVGSSANSTSGRRCSARAIATRCCWPPESSGGRRRALSVEADLAQRVHAPRPGRPDSPASRAGSATFS